MNENQNVLGKRARTAFCQIALCYAGRIPKGSLLQYLLVQIDFYLQIFLETQKTKQKNNDFVCIIYFISVQFCSLVNFLKLSASFSLLLKVLSPPLSLSFSLSLMYSWIIWFSCIHFVSFQYNIYFFF